MHWLEMHHSLSYKAVCISATGISVYRVSDDDIVPTLSPLFFAIDFRYLEKHSLWFRRLDSSSERASVVQGVRKDQEFGMLCSNTLVSYRSV